MSAEAIKIALEKFPQIRAGTPRFVLLLLAIHHRADTGQCNPGINRISGLTGYGAPAIKRALSHLRSQSAILVVKRGRGAGNSNHYAFPSADEVNGAAGHYYQPADGCLTSPLMKVNGTLESSYGGRRAPRISKKKKSRKKSFGAHPKIPLPHGEKFASAWEEFGEHRREIGHPVTPTGCKRILNELAGVSEQEATTAIHEAITKGWRKPFPKKVSGNVAVLGKTPHRFVV